MKKTIAQEALAALVETGTAREFRVLRDGEAWRLELRLAAKWLPIRSRPELVRVRRSLTAVERFCQGLGIKVLTVELQRVAPVYFGPPDYFCEYTTGGFFSKRKHGRPDKKQQNIQKSINCFIDT